MQLAMSKTKATIKKFRKNVVNRPKNDGKLLLCIDTRYYTHIVWKVLISCAVIGTVSSVK